jgi:hypothetical protein
MGSPKTNSRKESDIGDVTINSSNDTMGIKKMPKLKEGLQKRSNSATPKKSTISKKHKEFNNRIEK